MKGVSAPYNIRNMREIRANQRLAVTLQEIVDLSDQAK
jgi:hypothetical protein